MPIFGAGRGNDSKGKVGRRRDPYAAFNFLVEIDGIISGGFMEVSGLGLQTDVERKMFGGENDIEYKFVKGTKFSDLTFKHGLTDEEFVWKWYDDVTKGVIERKNGAVYLLDHGGRAVVHWNFLDAYPIKWDGPAFNALSSALATETLVLVHHGLVRSKSS